MDAVPSNKEGTVRSLQRALAAVQTFDGDLAMTVWDYDNELLGDEMVEGHRW